MKPQRVQNNYAVFMILKKMYPVFYSDLLSVVYRRNNSWWKCTFLDLIQSWWLRFELVTVTRSYGTPLSEYETELGQGSSWKINGPCRIHMLKHYRIAWQDHRLAQTNYRPSKSIALPTPYFCQFPLSSSFPSILFTFPLSVSIFQFSSRFLRIFYLVIAFSINSDGLSSFGSSLVSHWPFSAILLFSLVSRNYDATPFM